MNNAFFTGVSGMYAYQRGIDNIANNIANISTPAYKKINTSFSDILNTHMDIKSNPDTIEGHGIKHIRDEVMYKQGSLHPTENILDFAIIGDGFFAVENANGDRAYTRAGIFGLSTERRDTYLTTSDGDYVLDKDGDKIELERKVSDTGKKLDSFDYNKIKDKLGVYGFDNPFELSPMGNLKYKETSRSGEAYNINKGNKDNSKSYNIIQGAFEDSSVDLSNEMANLIETQKAFQFSAKVVQTADQIEEIINTLR